MHNQSDSFEFDPMDEQFLRSMEGQEVPPALPYIGGTKYPTKARFTDILASATEAKGAQFPHSCPILGSNDGSTRYVLYNKTVELSPRRRDAHIALWGPTGTGKTTKGTHPLLLSDLFDQRRSVVSISLKREEYPLVAAACAEQGIPLLYIDLNDYLRSVGFNPLEHVTAGEAYSTISSFVELVVNRDSHDSEFWHQSGSLFIYAAWCTGCHSFADILDLLEGPRDQLLARFDACDNSSCRAASAFIRSGSQNAETVAATVSGWLNPWRQTGLRATTSTQELDRATLFSSRKAIVIRCPETKISSLRPVYNLLIQWLIDGAIESADADPHNPDRLSVSFFIEDLPAWGAITSLVDRLATLRSRRICVVASIQSAAQLQYAYGSATDAVEKAFVNKIVLAGVDPVDAEYFATCTGVVHVTLSNDAGAVLDHGFFSRNVLSASDIRSPEWDHFLFGPPVTFVLQDITFQTYLCPIYLRPDAQRLLKSPAAVTKPPLRAQPLEHHPLAPPVGPAKSPLTDTRRLSPEQLEELIEKTRTACGWDDTTGSARRWWEAFERENQARRAIVLRLLEELRNRGANITEFFLAYVYGNCDNIMACLHYLDYTRLKKEEERKKRREKAATPAPRRQSDELANEHDAGEYHFDGFIEDTPATASMARWSIQVDAGDTFPRSRNQKCWWKRAEIQS